MIRHGLASLHLAIMLLREMAALAIDTADVAPVREKPHPWLRSPTMKATESSPSTSWSCRHLNASLHATHHRNPKSP